MHQENGSTNKARRSLLTHIAAGALVAGAPQLPRTWLRPVVETVMLPTHAETTGPSMTVYAGAALEVADDTAPSGVTRLAAGFLHSAVRPAGAVQPYPPTSAVCAIPSGNMLEITLQRSANNIRRRGMLNTDGTPGSLEPFETSPACEPPYDNPPYEPVAVGAYISEFDPEAGFNLHILRGERPSFVLWVPLADRCPEFAELDGLCNGESDA